MSKEKIHLIMEKYAGASRDSLIPLLQEVQEAEGYISCERVCKIGELLGLSTSKIYGVATFYNQFRFQVRGKYHILVCRGTACHVKGSADVLAAFEQELGISAGETDKKGLFSLEVVACIGACGLAPVISVNGEFHAGVDPKKVPAIVDKYRKGDDV